MQRYCAYIAPPSTATVLPSKACAAADETRSHHYARTFIANRQRLAHPRGHAFHGPLGNLCGHNRAGCCAGEFGSADVGRTKQQTNV